MIKLVTTSVGLDVLGPTYTWPTEVYLLGERNGWRLDGDLAIKGYGDPFRTYNVLPNALLVNYKAIRYQFGIYPDGDGVLVTTDPVLANLEITNRLNLASGRCRGYQAGITLDVRGEAADRVFLSGDFPAACAPYSLTRTALEHDSFAYGVFATLWRELGGVHTGGWRRGRVSEELEPILVWESPPLLDIIRRINKFSNNAMTRQLLYTLGVEASDRPGTRAGGVDVIRDHLGSRGLNVDSLVIDNGAGLSRRTRISAQLLADMLELAQRPPYGAEFVASMINATDAHRGTARLKRHHLRRGGDDQRRRRAPRHGRGVPGRTGQMGLRTALSFFF